jgi:hypothetical protein
MQPGTAQQVVALLQAAGALSPEAAAQALVREQHTHGTLLQSLITSGALSFEDLQEVLVLYGQLADGSALTTPAQCPRCDDGGAGADGG